MPKARIKRIVRPPVEEAPELVPSRIFSEVLASRPRIVARKAKASATPAEILKRANAAPVAAPVKAEAPEAETGRFTYKIGNREIVVINNNACPDNAPVLRPVMTKNAIADYVAYRARWKKEGERSVLSGLRSSMQKICRDIDRHPMAYLSRRVNSLMPERVHGNYFMDNFMRVRALIEYVPAYEAELAEAARIKREAEEAAKAAKTKKKKFVIKKKAG